MATKKSTNVKKSRVGKKSFLGIFGLGFVLTALAGQALVANHNDQLAQAQDPETALRGKIEAVLSSSSEDNASSSFNARQDTRLVDQGALRPLHVSASAAVATPPSAGHQLQFNPTFLAEWTHEAPFIDHMKVKGFPNEWRWIFVFKDKVLNAKQAAKAGYLDPVSGDIKTVPPGLIEIQGPLMVFGYSQFPEWYAGDWVLTWEGQADVTIWDKKVKVKSSTSSANGGRMVFTMPSPKSVPGAEIQRGRFSNIRTPIKNLKLVRLQDEKRHNAGQIWHPVFLEQAKKYNIIRTMNWQNINGNPARRFADIAKPGDPHFVHRPVVTTPDLRPHHDRYGIPYEYLFDLAEKTNNDLWLHIPIQIGSTLHQSDALGNVEKIAANARVNGRAIVESPAWDEFAREFTKRLTASKYPKNRPLYIELGNEVWNYAYPFALATRYADGIAKSFETNQSERYGYGILTARMILSLETALENTGYTPVYILASHTANPYATKVAFDGLTTYLCQKNINPSSITKKIGVALTTYHGGEDAYRALVKPQTGENLVQAYEREIITNGSALKSRLHSYYTNSSEDVILTKAWIVERWKRHREMAATYNAKIIGAYEGGSHDNPPPELIQSEIFKNWWSEYHWGVEGSDVVRQVNRAIIDEFPGVILSNFTPIGASGDHRSPWYDGHYSENTEMSRMWSTFERRP